MDPRTRYLTAGLEYMRRETPFFYEQSGGAKFKLKVPDTTKANGLTQYVLQYLTWMGHRATRISSSGRMVGGKWIKGTTRRGAADVSSTIAGRSVQWEIKVGADRPSEFQLREQALERKAGGEYFFTHTPEEFFRFYDSLFDKSDQLSIFDQLK